MSKRAREGDIRAAENKFRQAQSRNPDRAYALPTALALNTLCWHGALWGEADRVLPYCEQAVSLASDDSDLYDSRGLARALTGDTQGAIEDFALVVERWTADYRNEDWIALRAGWQAMLEAGEDPFDEATLEALREMR